MIEVNLVPDIKQELIRAKQVRNYVISGAVIIGLVSVAAVILLAMWLFGAQALLSSSADSNIKKYSQELESVPDINNVLTIQNQLDQLTALHNDKNMYSRFFNLLTAINPPAPNQVSFSLVRIDSDTGSIHLEGQALNGYVAADVLKKTILGTTFAYGDGQDRETVPITDDVVMSDLSYGEDSTGRKVLRFTIDFEYASEIFDRQSANALITPPKLQNATDSHEGVPTSLFTTRAQDEGGE